MGNKNGSLDPEGRPSLREPENSYHSNARSSIRKSNTPLEESVFRNSNGPHLDA